MTEALAAETHAVALEVAQEASAAAPKKVKKRRAPPTRVSWEERIAMLKAYKEEFGDLLIPIRYKPNPSLGKFIHNTREQYKLFHKKTPATYRKKCSLTQDRIDELEALGFVWNTQRTQKQNEDWDRRFQQLEEYKEKHGDCLVPHGYSEDPSFAEWIHRQRTTYVALKKSKKPNPLIQERMDRLAAIDFNFTVHSDKWMEHYLLLKKYREDNGDCKVPTHFKDVPKLGRWVHTQRHQRKLQQKGEQSCMTDERVKLLDDLDFDWEIRPSLERARVTWDQRFKELCAYKEEHGDFFVKDQPLQGWAIEQKQRLKALEKNRGKDTSKRMGPQRVEALAKIGFTVEVELEKKDGEEIPAAAAAVVKTESVTKKRKRKAAAPADAVEV